MSLDQGSSPFWKYANKYNNEIISSFLDGVSPFWYAGLENSILKNLSFPFFYSYPMCSRVCISLNLIDVA